MEDFQFIDGLKGECPHCGEDTDYIHCDHEPGDDTLNVSCRCNKCGKTFREIYIIAAVEKDDEGLLAKRISAPGEILKWYADRISPETKAEMQRLITEDAL